MGDLGGWKRGPTRAHRVVVMVLSIGILPSIVFAASLVPCGFDGPACTLCHVKILGIRIFNWLLSIGGAAALLALIVSGVRYIAAHGEAEEIESAKRGLRYTITGLATLLLSYVLVNTVLMVFNVQNSFREGFGGSAPSCKDLVAPADRGEQFGKLPEAPSGRESIELLEQEVDRDTLDAFAADIESKFSEIERELSD